MQVRYVFDPDLQHARARLALSLVPLLAQQLELKAEPAGGSLPEAWKSLYPHLSRPMLQPRVQIFAAGAGFVAHPLQWNVLLEPDAKGALDSGVDEFWVFSLERAEALTAAGVVREQIRILPPAVGELQADPAAAPMELNEPGVIFCSLPWAAQDRLAAVLRACIPACHGDVTLALHLEPPTVAHDEIESRLMDLVETIAGETGTDLETLNLETWIGPLEAAGYLALLQRCKLLLAPDGTLQAFEALSLGKQVLGLENRELELSGALTPESLQAALDRPRDALEAAAARERLVAAICSELERIEAEVDFSAREAAWQQDQEHARQGRKQKYSLFHSDYQEPEMQARRQWHLRYARYFEGAPGDVLDIGCGSGIFLEIARELGLPACGVDPDPDMVDVCRELGLQALAGDERLLEQWQLESLGGIHASHVIEHVDGSRAISLIENAFRTLRPGGRLVVRTPNWRNETVRHEGFWLDITHIRPYPLPLLKQVFEDAGFTIDQMGYEEFGWSDTYIVGRKPGGTHG
ncbi:MAG: class I SAM-dependent methyltransferase [Candidatus Sericytochromatia bacterium]